MDGQNTALSASATWTERFGQKHRWVRLVDFPTGILAPKKVRIYRRAASFIMSWWDPGLKKNQSERVTGDLLTALVRARELDDRVENLRTAGVGRDRRIGHADLVNWYLSDLKRRIDSGGVAPRTLDRYRAALAHYLAYCDEPNIARSFPTAATVNREFRLGFASFLAARSIHSNGRSASHPRPMRSQTFVLDTVRSMYTWAADPDRGNLLPTGFRNCFLRTGEGRPVFRGDPLAEPDITMEMAADFLRACDGYAIRLFAAYILFGLRASEPCFLCCEHFTSEWLLVPNIEGLDYQTKGKRDKRFPLITELAPFRDSLLGRTTTGLLYVQRRVVEGRHDYPLVGASLQDVIDEYRRRLERCPPPDRANRLRVRDAVLRDAGALRYDDVDHEFRRLASKIGWARKATLKDFRHLFATTLANAGMPEGYRKYLMGHAPGRDAAVAYTHLTRLREVFAEALRNEWGPVLAVLQSRFH